MAVKKIDDILAEIREYCNLNNIDDFEDVVCKCMSDGFNILRFGLSPKDNYMREKGIVKQPTTQEEIIKPSKTTKKTRTIKENA